MSRRSQKVEIYLADEGRGLALFSTRLEHIFGSNAGNELVVMFLGRGHNKLEFAYDVFRMQPVILYTDLIEYKQFGDTKTRLPRCFIFISNLKAGDIISTVQYMNIQTLFEFAAPEVEEVVSGKNKLQTAAKCV